jgi:hypothetical protein
MKKYLSLKQKECFDKLFEKTFTPEGLTNKKKLFRYDCKIRFFDCLNYNVEEYKHYSNLHRLILGYKMYPTNETGEKDGQ